MAELENSKDLISVLWSGADILRSKMDANEYKNYLLGIVFYKYLSDLFLIKADFCILWHASKDDVMYAATHYRNREIPNESAIKATIDYTSYKAVSERALPKFKYYAQMMAELRKTLEEEIKPLISR